VLIQIIVRYPIIKSSIVDHTIEVLVRNTCVSIQWSVGNVMGYPGVFQGNPYPYPSIPIPASTGTGFPWVTQGYCIYKYHLLLLHSTYIVITDDEGQTLIAVSEVKQRHNEEGRALLVVLKWE